MRATTDRQERRRHQGEKQRLENMAVDPVGYILITVNGSMGPRGACFWPFRVGGVWETALWTHTGVGPHGFSAWEVSQKRLSHDFENRFSRGSVAPNE